jgi:hypothetical protein
MQDLGCTLQRRRHFHTRPVPATLLMAIRHVALTL